MQVITPESTSCPVLRRGYSKSGSTDPLLAHPTNPDLLRQLTVTEHARIKEVPPELVHGMTKTDGHALLGQSVAYMPVKALFARIGTALLKWADQGRGGLDNQALNYRLNLATG
jgi:DNA (cytosine-5)-methyltransferase 1